MPDLVFLQPSSQQARHNPHAERIRRVALSQKRDEPLAYIAGINETLRLWEPGVLPKDPVEIDGLMRCRRVRGAL